MATIPGDRPRGGDRPLRPSRRLDSDLAAQTDAGGRGLDLARRSRLGIILGLFLVGIIAGALANELRDSVSMWPGARSAVPDGGPGAAAGPRAAVVTPELAAAEAQQRGRIAELERQREAAGGELAGLRDEVAAAAARLTTTRAELTAAEGRIRELDEQRTTMRADLDRLTEARGGLGEELGRLMAERRRLEGAIIEAETQRAALAATPATAPVPAEATQAPPTGRENAAARVGSEPRPPGPPTVGGEPAGRARLFVHYSGLDPAARGQARELADRLARDEVVIADVRAVPFAIGSNRLRFFHPADRARAAALERTIQDAESGTVQLQDFTSFEPPPLPGTLELWLSGS